MHVTGTTQANADMTVMLPTTSQTWTGTAAADGSFDITITAPSDDDDTTASYDLGSHGIVVWANTGSGSADCTVVTLVLADLPDVHFVEQFPVSQLDHADIPLGDHVQP